jgi:two-component system, response regulator YesN
VPARLAAAHGTPIVFEGPSNGYFLKGNDRLILIAFPFPLDALRSDSFILVAVDPLIVGNAIGRYFPRLGSTAVIEARSGVLVAGVGDTAALAAARARHGAGTAVESWSWDGYHVSMRAPEASLFVYSSMVSRDQVLEPIRGLQRTFLLIVLGTLLVGFVGVYGFMTINYTPIRDLRRFIESRLQAHSDENDEILAIERVVEQYSEGVDRLQDVSREATQEHLVTRLLQGQIRSLDELNGVGTPAAQCFSTGGCFRVVVWSLDVPEMPDKTVLDDVRRVLEAGGLCVAHRLDVREHETSVVGVVSHAPPSEPPGLLALLHETQQVFVRKLGVLPSVGVGDPCDSPDQVGRSYIQAMAGLDYTLVKGRGEIVLYGELPRAPRGDSSGLIGPIDDLKLSIREGDGEAVERIMGGIVDHIKARRYPLFEAKCMCFDLINAVLHTAQDCGVSLSDSSDGLPTARMGDFRTIDDLAGIVRDFSAVVRATLAGGRRVSVLSVGARTYIQKHFSEPDFYIQGMCESLAASPSHLSQTFKQAYGTTMCEYLSRLRIEEAQRLLAGTSLGVDEIIRKVGYTDRSSFSKKFRAWVGATPGEYRRASRAQDARAV